MITLYYAASSLSPTYDRCLSHYSSRLRASAPPRLRASALMLLAGGLLTVSLGACDAATNTTAPAGPAFSLLDRGPALSAFPAAALLDMTEAESLLADSSALRTSNGDTLVFVPLVFDDAGLLHSPESFKDLLIALEAASTVPLDPAVYFTDLGTFDSVLATTGNAASGRSHVNLYAQGERGRLQVAGFGTGGGATPAYVDVFDPYVLPNLTPPPCEPDDENCNGGGGGPGGGDPDPNPDYRPPVNQSPDYGTTPAWPSLWKGDVLSGDTENGGGSSGSGNLGHSSIVTKLNNNEQDGGTISLSGTRVMEAIGKRPNAMDEVVERAARTYWIDEGNRVNHVLVRFHHTASWGERDEAIAYARAQDPDNYNAVSPKWWRYSWYCSKLVWAAYGEATGDDLDPNWGYWVMPEDLKHSGHLRTAYHFVYNGNV